MKRRIVCIICIMFLLFTITSPLSGGVFSYAEDNITLPTQEQKIELGMMTYYNYRKGWFTSQASSTVPGLLVRYAQQFFDDPANNTGINSMSELADTITLSRSSGHWKVTITNQGLTFLDNLTKWMLGKNDFPNLYSGGSWGGENITNDSAYRGWTTNGYLYYVIENARTANPSIGGGYVYDFSNVQFGSPVQSINGKEIFIDYLNQFGITSEQFFDRSNSNSELNVDSIQKTIQYFSDVSLTFTWLRGTTINSTQANIYPMLRTLNGYSANPSNAYNNATVGAVYTNRVNQLVGNPALILNCYNGVNNPYIGWVTYDNTNDKITCQFLQAIDKQVSPANINLETNNFDKQDLAGDPDDPDTPASVTFTPVRGSDPSVNNTYNNETVNNFYNEYVTNYTENNSSVINEGDIINPDDPDDPDDPDQPSGGTTPPWDNSSGVGTLTPDGNGGYTFNLPDLTIPDLNIDWNLRGLSEKFPFSIPWDLMAFFTVLNAEPETPAIEAQIDLGIVDWDINWDLHNFDTLAALLRNLEFIGFCLALILITRSIIKG